MKKAFTRKRPPLRIFHGVLNIAGKGTYLAEWQRRHKKAVADCMVYLDFTPFQNSHLNLHLEYLGFFGKAVTGFSFLLVNLFRYDIFHFYFATSFLPFNIDLPILKLFGKKIIMTYCGSEARLIEIEAQRNPFHAQLRVEKDDPRYDRHKKWMFRWHGLWIDRFFAFRSLYDSAVQVIPAKKIVDRHLWLNNTVEPGSYTPDYTTRDEPIIVHAPTLADIKGTVFIEEAIERLTQKGYRFSYKRIEKTSPQEARRLYQEADIIIDQVLLGDFGNVSVEGMLYGKPVCSYLHDDIMKWYPECPIINITIETIEEKLAWLIERPEERIRLGRAGRAFVEQHADRDTVYERTWSVYNEMYTQ